MGAFVASFGWLILSGLFFWCCRCACICPCCWEESRGNCCGGRCGPDNCCRPSRHSDDYTCCRPMGGKLVAILCWFLWVILGMAFAGIAIGNGETITNGIIDFSCELSVVGTRMNGYTANIENNVTGVETLTNAAFAKADTLAATAPPGDIENVLTALTTLEASVTNLMCPGGATWDPDAAGCTAPVGGAGYVCTNRDAAAAGYNAACPAGVGTTAVCCQGSGLATAWAIATETYDAAKGANQGVDAVKRTAVSNIASTRSTVQTFKTEIQSNIQSIRQSSTDSFTSARSSFSSIGNFTGSSYDDSMCSVKDAVAVVKRYTQGGVAGTFVFTYIAVLFGLIGLVAMLICKPQIGADTEYPKTNKCGCLCTQWSWMCGGQLSLLLLSLIGIAIFVLAIVIGETCYSFGQMPSNPDGFNAYLGTLLPAFSIGSSGATLRSADLLTRCYRGTSVFDLINLTLPANLTDQINLDQINSLAAAPNMGDWNTQKAQINQLDTVPSTRTPTTPGDTFTQATTNIDNQIASLTASATAIKSSVGNAASPAGSDTLFAKLTAVDAAIPGIRTAVDDCGFFRTTYDEINQALCQKGLSGSLWIALCAWLVGVFGIGMMFSSIVINIRMSGLGQWGTYYKGSGGSKVQDRAAVAVVAGGANDLNYEMPNKSQDGAPVAEGSYNM